MFSDKIIIYENFEANNLKMFWKVFQHRKLPKYAAKPKAWRIFASMDCNFSHLIV